MFGLMTTVWPGLTKACMPPSVSTAFLTISARVPLRTATRSGMPEAAEAPASWANRESMSDMAASAPAAAVLFKKVRLSVIFMPTSVVYPRMREHAEGFMPLPNTRPAKKQPVILPAPEFHKRIVIQAELLYNPVMKCSLLSRPMTCAHDWISRVVSPGDAVVDATAGNGHDTVFLARLVGPSGQVHAFDVQEEAIRATRERLEKEGLLTPSVRLHLASHDRLAELVRSPVKAIVFNLGYLPGGDKKTVTRTECTLAALEQAAALIAPNGLLSVMCYPGHEGGKEEAEAVEAFLSRLPHHSWRAGKYQLLNTGTPAPFQICAFRLD